MSEQQSTPDAQASSEILSQANLERAYRMYNLSPNVNRTLVRKLGVKSNRFHPEETGEMENDKLLSDEELSRELGVAQERTLTKLKTLGIDSFAMYDAMRAALAEDPPNAREFHRLSTIALNRVHAMQEDGLNQTTKELHSKNGEYEPEWKQKHAEIVRAALEKVKSHTGEEGDRPKFLIIGGLQGAGKTAASKRMRDFSSFVTADPDALRKLLYGEGYDEANQQQTLATTEEADEVNDMILKAAREGIQEENNFLEDGGESVTGKKDVVIETSFRDLDWLNEEIGRFKGEKDKDNDKDKGYIMQAVWIYRESADCLDRTMRRERGVNTNVMEKTLARGFANFQRLIDNLTGEDEAIILYDTGEDVIPIFAKNKDGEQELDPARLKEVKAKMKPFEELEGV